MMLIFQSRFTASLWFDGDFVDAGFADFIKHGDGITQFGFRIAVKKDFRFSRRGFEALQARGQFGHGNFFFVQKILRVPLR